MLKPVAISGVPTNDGVPDVDDPEPKNPDVHAKEPSPSPSPACSASSSRNRCEFVGEFSKMPNKESGLAAFEARDYTKAFELLKPIAEQGDAEAQCIVANIYQLGLDIERSDSSGSEAIKWYIRSAQQGYGVASNNLAEIFRAGSCGVAADQAEAEKWYHKAREQGFLHTRRNRG